MQTDRAPITIKAPEHGRTRPAVYRTATGARDFLIGQGVVAGEVRIVGYEAATSTRRSWSASSATRPAGRSAASRGATSPKICDNNGYDEFGCAVTANIAAQIAEPADLLHPRDLDPPDAQRRQTVLDKYRQGATTAAAKDSQANGAVSATAQQ